MYALACVPGLLRLGGCCRAARYHTQEEPVLTAQQLDHFATFGFVVLPGMLGGMGLPPGMF